MRFMIGGKPVGEGVANGSASRPDRTTSSHHDSSSSSDASSPDPHKDAEKGEQGPDSVGFLDKRLGKVRRTVFLAWGRTTLIICVFILAILSLYWGVLYRVGPNKDSLNVFVVDFDGQRAPYDDPSQGPPLVGPAILAAVRKQDNSDQAHLGYQIHDPADFPGGPTEVRQRVYDFACWAAVIVNPNATALLRQAVAAGNASYDPTGAAQIVLVTARDDTTYATYVTPELTGLGQQASAAFGEKWASQLLGNLSDPATLRAVEKVPQAISGPIAFTTQDLRPFYPPDATPTVTIGLIYLIILSFYSFPFYMPVHMKFLKPPGDDQPGLNPHQWIIWRYFSTVVAYFFISLAYSLISLAFQIPFSRDPGPQTETAFASAYGRGTFPAYWTLNFVGAIAVGLPSENVSMVVGSPWFALWLVFWVITNVSTSFYELALAPTFYNWGYAWPLHSVVEGSRCLIFDLHNHLGLDFGILLAWAGVSTALYPVACLILKKKQEKGMM